MKEHYVSYECAVKLKELGFEGVDKYYVTENFCSGNNPISFDTFSVGDLVDEHIVYFVNENNEDDYRGIPAPRLDQAQAWLREVKGIDIEINAYQHLDGESIKHQYNFGVLTINGETFANTWYNNYEQALSDAIDTALELLTNQPTAI